MITERTALRGRSAFTLLELLMVLAVMTMIVALGIPSVSRLLARARFKDGVFEIQAELAQTRLLSMKTGEAYLFRYLPGTNRYRIVTKKLFEEEQALRRTNRTNPLAVSVPSRSAGEFERTFSADVRIDGGVISDGTELRLSTAKNAVGAEGVDLGSRAVGSLATPGAGEPLGDVWSEPILFYPNGRTSNAVFFLASTGSIPFYSEVALRGFTGGVRVSTIASVPPGSPDFPSVLPPEIFARLYRSSPDSSVRSDPNAPFVDAGETLDGAYSSYPSGARQEPTGVILPESAAGGTE